VGSTSNKYQISSDGVVFCIEDDGTIVRLARVTEKGKVEPIRKHGKVDETDLAKSAHSSWNIFFLVLLIAFAAAAATFALSWQDEKSDREKLSYDLEDLRHNFSRTESDLKDTEAKLAAAAEKNSDLEVKLRTCEIKAASSKKEPEEAPKPPEPKIQVYEPEDNGPLIINSIEVRNTTSNPNVIISDFGEKIYSSNAKFLQPRIRYTSRIYGTKVLDVKIYDANGYLRSGANSKEGYTYSVRDVDIRRTDDGTYLFKTGWGGENGFWPKGQCTIEIWSDGKFLKSGKFEIY